MRSSRLPPSDASIDLDRYAEITAHVRHFPGDKKDEVVARLGVRRRVWEAASARWSKDLDDSLEEGRADLVERYSAAFARARRRLAWQQPTIESLGPLPEPEPAEAPELAPGPAPPPMIEPQVAIPSYLSSPQMDGAPRPLAPQTAPFPGAPRPPDKPSFMSPAAWSAPAAPRQSPAIVPDVVIPATAPALAAAAARGSTMEIPVMPASPPKLPFSPAEATPERAIERAVAHANTVQGPPRDSNPLGATMEGTFLPAATLPFGKMARPIPQYSVERYASLRVELHEYSDRAAEVLARYQLDRDTCDALDDDYKDRFKADPSLRSRFLDACERYRTWLRSRDAGKTR